MGNKRVVQAGAVMLAATLAIAGCSKSPAADSGASKASASPAAAASASAGTSPSGADLSKKLEIEWLGVGARGKIEDGNPVQKKLEEKFNVKLINKKVDINNADQANLMIASGGLPEMSFTYVDPYKMYSDQLTRTIPIEMIKKYAPQYAALLSSQPTGWKVNKAKNEDAVIALTGYAEASGNVGWLHAYRLDWLEKVGIAPKGQLTPMGDSGELSRIFFTKQSFTLAEEEKIMDAFVNGDPDGNGQKDTHAIALNTNALHYALSTYAGTFGFGWNYNVEENGKVVEYNISSKYKSLLQQLNAWYKKGYIDPEFTTLNLAKTWEKYAAGKFGITPVIADAVAMVPYAIARPPGVLASKDPKAKFLITPPPIGANGAQFIPSDTQVDNFNYNMVVRKGVSDEKLIRMLQMFEYINFDKDMHVLATFGVAGTDFDWEGTPYDSAVVAKPNVALEPKGSTYYNFVIRSGATSRYLDLASKRKLNDMFTATPEGKSLLIRPYKADRFNETKYKDLLAVSGAKLNTIRDEFFYKAVTGETDVAKDWDGYVKNWLSSGGNELLAELEKAPAVAELLKK